MVRFKAPIVSGSTSSALIYGSRTRIRLPRILLQWQRRHADWDCQNPERRHQQARDIMERTGHKSEAMVSRYIRDGNFFRSKATAALGL